MQSIAMTDHEFGDFRLWLHKKTGIHLSASKKPLVSGRLAKRLQHHNLGSFGDYFRLLTGGQSSAELQTALDLLTTNETYFFREPRHFEFLRDSILPAVVPGRPFRVWSAASSSGQEAYSIAMVLAERLGDAPWEIVGTDLSRRVLEQARSGLYPLEQSRHIPERYLQQYCLKGIGSQLGFFLMDERLRSRVTFFQANLIEPLPEIGQFDLIVLRNVMIYFDQETKRRLVDCTVGLLRKDGHYFVGHAESLNGVTDRLHGVQPAIYRRKQGQ